MTDHTDTLGKPVRVMIAPDGTTMFLDTVVGVDMNGKPITVSSLNDITGAALREHRAFYESVCDTTAFLVASINDDANASASVRDYVQELANIVWPAPRQEEKPEQVDAEKPAQ